MLEKQTIEHPAVQYRSSDRDISVDSSDTPGSEE